MAALRPRLSYPKRTVAWQRDEPTPTPAPSTTRERAPEGATLLVAGVGVPVLRALVTGTLFGGLVMVMALPFVDSMRYILWAGGAAAAAVTFGAWLLSYAPSWRMIEAWSGIDLNRDGQVGKPSHNTVTIEVREPRDLGGGKVTWRDVTLPEGVTIGRIATSVLDGTFTERQWTGRGRPFSQESFRRLRDEAMAAGLLAWADPNVPQMGVIVPPDAVAKWKELERKG